MREYKRALKVAVALVTLSVVAATSSTLAWVTTRRSLSISFSDATVRIDGTNLQVDYKDSFNTTMVGTKQSYSVLKLSSDSEVRDISSDGIKFYEPFWSGIHNTIANGGDGLSLFKAHEITDITPRKPGTYGVNDQGLMADDKFIDFTLTLSRNEEAEAGMYVFLGEETKLTLISGNSQSLNVLKALRLAVIGYSDNDSDSGTPEVILRHAPENEPDPHYIALGGSSLYGAPGFSLEDDVELKSDPFETRPEYDDALLLYPPVADLTAATGSDSVDVTFRIWIEGTDKDALDPIVYQEFGLVLDLYVVNED